MDVSKSVTIDIRQGGGDADAKLILDLLDGAVSWLAEQGRTGQWGSDPASQNPGFIRHATDFAAGDGLYIATVNGEAAGALAIGAPHGYVPAVAEPEVYIQLLVTSKAHRGLGVGGRLLDHARDLARQQDVALLRVDCYRGPDRKLVRYYESQGFTATEEFSVDKHSRQWPGQILQQRLR